jgi:hypothetical protein
MTKVKENIEGLNGLPVNQKAREMLQQVGEEPDSACVYCVQLALWGLEKGKVEVESTLSETVKAMMTWRPVRIMNFLMMEKDMKGYNPAGWEEANSPVDLARVILDEIENKMLIHFPWYQSHE